MPQFYLHQLQVDFTQPIERHELDAFRGAVGRTVGLDNVLFHNHLEEDKVRYAYPLIQYKRRSGRPLMVCLGDGVDAVPELFKRSDGRLTLNNRPYQLQVADVRVQRYALNISRKKYSYDLRHWLPLNDRNYAVYQEFQKPEERHGFLERLLVGNILSFAKGVGWWIDGRVEATLHQDVTIRVLTYKDVPMMTVDASFETNVFLPPWIGLGKGVARGHGIVMPARAIDASEADSDIAIQTQAETHG